ncbi:MAG: hypothetical protein BM564_11975 [Bacteroidetes bacterium MedPE-SWsnd-G2]|nr:MAG: hypothetical protein BM564_11975 [Bacteroidetes bacterium MedPE-SWsnd-G2]
MSYSIPESEYPLYYHNYVKQVHITSIKEGFEQSLIRISKLGNTLDGLDGEFRYQEGKWTIKELLLHIIDTERVFSYRALAIVRGDKASLPGFEQDDYVVNCEASSRSLDSVLEEYRAVRVSTLQLFGNLSESKMKTRGVANGNEITVRAIALIVLGHENHHLEILKNRYL